MTKEHGMLRNLTRHTYGLRKNASAEALLKAMKTDRDNAQVRWGQAIDLNRASRTRDRGDEIIADQAWDVYQRLSEIIIHVERLVK